jgi:diguanylate cyclase (GGDEF)-like protein/PAS domain S-box-containing protein
LTIGDREGAVDVRTQWEQTFSGSSRGISVTDPVSGIIQSVNPAFAAMHGGTMEDFVGRLAESLLSDEFRQQVPQLLAQIDGSGHLQVEVDRIRLDGTVFPVAAESITTIGDDGLPLYRIAWFEDLTDRRAAEAAHREVEARFETAFTSAPSGVALISLDGRFLRVNGALCTLLGRTEDELVGGTSKHFTHPDDQGLTARAFVDLNTTATVVSITKRYLRPDGEVVWASTHGATVHDAQGHPRYIVSHFQDITARTLAEQRQAEAGALVESALTSAPIGMALVGLDGRWLKVNDALCELSGHSEEELLALTFQAMTHPDDLEDELAEVQRLLAGEIDIYTSEKRFLNAEGRLMWVNRSGSLIRRPDGEPRHYVVHIQDISERKRLADTLQDLADSDPLTNLWNRRRFEEELERQIGRRRRYGDETALLMVDLNRFKPVNDTYGHAVGDELLKAVATALRKRIRATDSIARLGGDEFVVMLTNVSRAMALRLSAELQATVAGVRVTAGDEMISITASIGMTILNGDAADAQAALSRADAAMYDVKVAGPSR